MIENIGQYLMPIYTSIVSLLLGFLIGKIKDVKATQKAEREALGALLRHDMFEIYEEYRDAPEVPNQVQTEMHSLWEAYHGLSFNHQGDKIHDEICNKPTKV